jgi:hypothetical protein
MDTNDERPVPERFANNPPSTVRVFKPQGCAETA